MITFQKWLIELDFFWRFCRKKCPSASTPSMISKINILYISKLDIPTKIEGDASNLQLGWICFRSWFLNQLEYEHWHLYLSQKIRYRRSFYLNLCITLQDNSSDQDRFLEISTKVGGFWLIWAKYAGFEKRWIFLQTLKILIKFWDLVKFRENSYGYLDHLGLVKVLQLNF